MKWIYEATLLLAIIYVMNKNLSEHCHCDAKGEKKKSGGRGGGMGAESQLGKPIRKAQKRRMIEGNVWEIKIGGLVDRVMSVNGEMAKSSSHEGSCSIRGQGREAGREG